MGKAQYILALDEGTTGITVQVFNHREEVVSSAYKEIPQYFPKPGWVEHDAEKIWQITQKNIQTALQKAKIKPNQIAAIGITNQRETFLLWDRQTGKPQGKAIVWQCRRSGDYCDKLKKQKLEPWIQKKTGLKIDPYFSLTKLKLYLDEHPSLRRKAAQGKVLFGTMDSWLLWKLTGGEVHATDWTNASRTMMFNIDSLSWDKEILKKFKIPTACLPNLQASQSLFGTTKGVRGLVDGTPIAGMVGDQQAALFGQGCMTKGMAKNTYGTGCFLLQHTGAKRVHSKGGLLTSVAASDASHPAYMLEGAIFIAGAAIQWLRDGLKFFNDSAQSEKIATSVAASDGVVVVPAFVGLGAPYWRSDVRGAIFGLTRGTTQEHIVRATLESLAFQTKDVFDLIQKESGIPIKELRVDGGATKNNFLMQFQSDLLNRTLLRPKNIETTVKGAALLAGLTVGYWKNKKELASKEKWEKRFSPKKQNLSLSQKLYSQWTDSVQTLCQ